MSGFYCAIVSDKPYLGSALGRLAYHRGKFWISDGVATGRGSEILKFRWDHVDLGSSCLRLPDSKTRSKIVALGAPAQAVLNTLPRIKENPYVMSGVDCDHAPLSDLSPSFQRLLRPNRGIQTFATIENRFAMRQPKIPSLVFRGRLDEFVSFEQARRLIRRCGGA